MPQKKGEIYQNIRGIYCAYRSFFYPSSSFSPQQQSFPPRDHNILHDILYVQEVMAIFNDKPNVINIGKLLNNQDKIIKFLL